MALIVNLFGGPSTGKSTTATGVFHFLKVRHHTEFLSEYVSEVAKDFTWEDRMKTLSYNFYVTAKQYRNLARVAEQVDVVVTDSPLLLGSHYAKEYTDYPQSYHDTLTHFHRSLGTPLNIFLIREKAYEPRGRNQDEFTARSYDEKIKNMLISMGEEFIEIPANESAPQKIIYEHIIPFINANKKNDNKNEDEVQ